MTCVAERGGKLEFQSYAVFEYLRPSFQKPVERESSNQKRAARLEAGALAERPAWVGSCSLFSLGVRYFCESLPLILSKENF